MAEKERSFLVSQDQATDVYRQLMTGNGTGIKITEKNDRDLKRQLGIDSTKNSSPENAILGTFLIAYINASTRLLDILEKKDQAFIKSINKQLVVPDGEISQQTFEKLLKIAFNNSQALNPLR